MSLQLRDLIEHPHDRGEFTYGEWLWFLSDWETSGVDDVMKFAAGSPTWRDTPAYFFTNTVLALTAGMDI